MKGSKIDSGRLVQGMILLGFTVYLIKLLATGEVNNLLSPLAANLLIATAGVMTVMTFYSFATMIKKESGHHHDHGHHHHHEHAATHDHGHDHHAGCNHDHGHDHHAGCNHDHGHEHHHHAGCNHDHGHDHDHANCDHDHDHDHNPKPQLLWTLIAAPMVLGFLFPTTSLGSSAINNGLQIAPTQSIELSNTVETATSQPTTTTEQTGTTTTPDASKQPAQNTQTGTQTPTQTQTGDKSTTPAQEKKPAVPLGSAAASSYAVDMGKVPRAKGGVPGEQPKAGEEVRFSDIMMDIAIKPEWYYNNRFKFIGFVYRPEGWPAERMILMRFMITHCSADATPIGMYVESKEAAQYKNDTWIEMDATVSLKEMRELDNIPPAAWFKGFPYKPILVSHSMKTIEQPKYPYLLSRALTK